MLTIYFMENALNNFKQSNHSIFNYSIGLSQALTRLHKEHK